MEATREVAQSGLHPSNCRLLDHDEALLSGSGDGSHAILVLGFESGDHELDAWLARALEICAGHAGEVPEQAEDAAAVWRAAFLRGPHTRDAMAQLGLIHETFETAVTWDRFAEFHEGVLAAVRAGARGCMRRRCDLLPLRLRLSRRPLAVLLGLRARPPRAGA